MWFKNKKKNDRTKLPVAGYGSVNVNNDDHHPQDGNPKSDENLAPPALSSSSFDALLGGSPSDDVNDHNDHRDHEASSLVHSIGRSFRGSASLAGSVTSSVRSLIVDGALRHPGRPVSVRTLGGHSTISRSSFTLIKNLVGAGVLALPSGVAAFADNPSAIWVATTWLIVMGFVFGYEFQLIAKVCDMTLSATFREAWDDSVSKATEYHPPMMRQSLGVVVSWVNAGKPFLGNLAYSMILADTFRSLFAAIGWEVARTTSLLVVTFVGILPLCLLKNLDALAPFSILGTLSVVVIAICMGIRCFDGTYDPRTGQYIDDLTPELQPLFGSYNGWWTTAVLVYVAMIFEAFVAHYNAPRFYSELQHASIPRFRMVVSHGFGASTILYIVIMCFGFLTFGGNCDGYILNNYSPHDPVMTTSRIFIAFSILFTYPVTFFGTRDGVLDILELPQEKQTSTNMNIITVTLLIIITVLAAVTTDLGLVNAVGGGSLATLIVFVFPAVMFSAAIDHRAAPPTAGEKREVTFAMILMVLGLIMGAIGVVVAIT